MGISVCSCTALPFEVYDPANPHKNVADNLTDATPLRDYATATLCKLKMSMAALLQRNSREAEQRVTQLTTKVAELTASTILQQRIMKLLHQLSRMKQTADVILSLPMSSMKQLIDAAPRGLHVTASPQILDPFTFTFAALVYGVETDQYGRKIMTKYLEIRLHVDVSEEWLELRPHLLKLFGEPWPSVTTELCFRRSNHGQQWSAPMVGRPFPKPETVQRKQFCTLTDPGSKVMHPAYPSNVMHTLAVSEFHSGGEVKCSIKVVLP